MILDASALLAVLRSEPGGELVAKALPDARMSVVNYAELVSHYSRLGADADAIRTTLKPLPIALVPVDAAVAASAGLLAALVAKAGLSLGDRFCLALAKLEEAPVWTADRAWTRIAKEAGVDVHLIR
ncbi:type II toxin-antitoxin system VapC family toxin [Sphingomonas sp.]|jgi:PIN domain nuclease of toxin-antitoxin system|uniref:PIN domain-containing protein n=1 Tax=Sphingomonas sp. TaxID=28214 RepID=UPI002DEAECDA|nr:type II toxin-antitoxin system VapC family toxin [Sphingomonas sp.]